MSESARDRGLQNRREILGDAHADRVAGSLDGWSEPFQDLMVRYGWDEVWGRPELDRRTRSLVTVAMLIALNRPHALKLHLAGALHNGATATELREVLLQAALYCGAPAAEEAIRLAREVLPESWPDIKR
jgi:4-carboxymuconolactone decarboxylase